MARLPALDPAAARAGIAPAVIDRPAPEGDRLAIVVPVRDAVSDIEPFFDAVARLDVPSREIKLAFCEGDSVDGSWERLNEVAAERRSGFREILLLRHTVSTAVTRDGRAARNIQRARRSGLAAVRNFLIDRALAEDDDWALWIDIDVWRFPSDTFGRLRGAGARIAVPNCVVSSGGPSFDRNSFVAARRVDSYTYYRYLRDGLFQPPADFWGRLHLSSLRHSERVPLDAVGGTMLLVDANLHRGGLRFPELPYRGLIETEGFGALARDVGIVPVGLPRLEVQHVPY